MSTSIRPGAPGDLQFDLPFGAGLLSPSKPLRPENRSRGASHRPVVAPVSGAPIHGNRDPVVDRLVSSTTREGPATPPALKTLDLTEAAGFLHMHPEEVRARAKRGLIPGAKAGRCWIFLEVDLAEFVRSLYPVKRQALRVTNISQEDVCHYANAGRFGGSTSSRRTANEYAELLKPTTRPRRKSCTTS